MEEAVGALKKRLSEVRKGGPEYMHKKHTERGKLFVRERLQKLFDPGTPFLEKPFSPRDLVKALRAILDNEA